MNSNILDSHFIFPAIPFSMREKNILETDFLIKFNESDRIFCLYYVPIFLFAACCFIKYSTDSDFLFSFCLFSIGFIISFIIFSILKYNRIKKFNQIISEGKRCYEIRFDLKKKEIVGDLKEIEKFRFVLRFINHNDFNISLSHLNLEYQFFINQGDKIEISFNKKAAWLFFIYKNNEEFMVNKIHHDIGIIVPATIAIAILTFLL